MRNHSKSNIAILKKIFFFTLFLACCCLQINAQDTTTHNTLKSDITDTSQLQISILTCAAGEDIYTAWGHSAIRVVDSIKHTDYVFNYGTFDFNEPYFLTKFIKGNLKYFISVNEYSDFIEQYKYEGRSIQEQVLKLTAAEKTKWYTALQINTIGDNRFYLYNFITDNCTTRVKDGLFTNAFIQPIHIPVRSFRDEVVKAPYAQGIPWIGFGIDLLLGAYSDQEPDNFKSGFLPPLLFNQIGSIKKLVLKTNTYSFSTSIKPVSAGPSPFVILLIILFFYAFVSKWNSLLTQKIAKVIDVVLLVLFSIGGSLVFYMSLISLHTACYENFNLMWLHPAYIIALVFYFIPKKWIGQLGMLFFSAQLGLLITCYWIPQHFSKEVFALMGIALLLNYRLILKGHYAGIK